MSSKTYTGRIWLKSGGHQVEVSCSATSPSASAKIIKAQYGNSFKSFAKQMSSS